MAPNVVSKPTFYTNAAPDFNATDTEIDTAADERTAVVTLRWSLAEHERAKELAHRLRVSLNKMCRFALNEYVERELAALETANEVVEAGNAQ